MEYINIGISLATFIAIIIVGFIKSNQIKSMKEIFDLYDIDKLKKYVKLNEESHKMEMSKMITALVESKGETISVLAESFNIITFMLNKMDDEQRAKFIKENLPASEKYIDAIEKIYK